MTNIALISLISASSPSTLRLHNQSFLVYKELAYNTPVTETKFNFSFQQYFESFSSTKLHRFFIFVTFITTFFCILICSSKLYKHLKLVKLRHRKYGYYFSARHEATVYIFYQDTKHKVKNLKHLLKMADRTIRKIYGKISIKKVDISKEMDEKLTLRDTGHENEVFLDSEDLLDSHEITFKVTEWGDKEDTNAKTRDITEEPEISAKQSWSRRSLKRLHDFLTDKRINSFKYLKVKDDAYEKYENLTIRTDMILKSVRKSLRRFSGRLESDSENAGNTEDDITVIGSLNDDLHHFKLPIVLITDTSSMNTKVIDMENFNPELSESKAI